ncbi:hypothetical protein [Brevibacillus laterosporus]|uniref:hypothetical protein n=1 Tax=Brevibacillus laterosporus TaxID=1465 RepID=UPI003D1E55D9
MGCDIHLWVERKNPDGRWEAINGVNEPELQWWQNTLERKKASGGDDTYTERRIKELLEGTHDFIFDGRHYVLFSLLAGVRNYYSVTPISEQKGLPEDVTQVVKEKSDEWGLDGHSHSWLSTRELVEFDWSKPFEHEGWVSENEYKKFKENGSPDSWSRGVGGGSVEHITNFDMDALISGNGLRWPDKSYYTIIKWTKPLNEVVDTFYSWSIPKLKELAGDDLDSVRIVFWFDN